jgi:hypothetical protein
MKIADRWPSNEQKQRAATFDPTQKYEYKTDCMPNSERGQNKHGGCLATTKKTMESSQIDGNDVWNDWKCNTNKWHYHDDMPKEEKTDERK